MKQQTTTAEKIMTSAHITSGGNIAQIGLAIRIADESGEKYTLSERLRETEWIGERIHYDRKPTSDGFQYVYTYRGNRIEEVLKFSDGSEAIYVSQRVSNLTRFRTKMISYNPGANIPYVLDRNSMEEI